MRLKNLHIQGYKNIQDLKIGFEDKDGITLLIGNNGTGKSNIIEALASIFAGLYEIRLHKPSFDYDITYEINFNKVSISLQAGGYTIHVNDEEMTKTAFQLRAKEFLPDNVVACYSGESLRLFERYFQPYYKRYVDALKKEDSIPVLPMIYVNKYNIKIALLTLFFCNWDEHEDVKTFCTEKLHIKRLTKVAFHYNNKVILSWQYNPVVRMIEQLNAIDGVGAISADTCTYKDMDELKAHLHYLDDRTFFKYMYAATMPLDNKAIKDIDIEMELDTGVIISIDELSEGEKKYLLIKTIMEVISTENSVILFDEPDAHIHITRKAELQTQLLPYNNRETIITTHSPTLAVCFDLSHLEGLGRNANGNTVKISKDKAKLVHELTAGMWSVHEQNAFLASNKPITILVEGMTDKEHIEEAFKHLKSDYSDLDFDIFSMNSSEHIREVLIGLSCSEVKWDKMFVGIFDNDGAGLKAIHNFVSDGTDNRIMHVKTKDGQPSDTFYAFLLPKKAEFGKNPFTIENCYAPDKYQSAFAMALKEKEGHFDGLPIDTIADDLKNKAKVILADKAKSFTKADFVWFKEIFEILRKIMHS